VTRKLSSSVADPDVADNLDHLLLNTDFLYEHEWRARSGFPVPIPRFDAAIAADHHLITIEMEDMSKSNAVADVSGYRARLCIEDRVMAEGRIVATEAKALYELYEAVNEIAEKYGRGRRRYIMEEGAL
jgi:hypothetical protein